MSSLQGTYASDISGANVVGWYLDSAGTSHGFIATVPEPSTFALLVAAVAALSLRRLAGGRTRRAAS